MSKDPIKKYLVIIQAVAFGIILSLGVVSLYKIGHDSTNEVFAAALRVFSPVQGGTGTGIPPAKGYILVGQTDGTYLAVATSTLGITASGDGVSNWLFDGTRLTPSTTPAGIRITASSTIGDGGAGGLTISGGATTTGNAYFGGRMGVGTTSGQWQSVGIQKTGITTTKDVGSKRYYGFTPGTGFLNYGETMGIDYAPSGASTLVADEIRITDNTNYANTVIGVESVAWSGTSITGYNAGIRGYGRTFGVVGYTNGTAGTVSVPAGVLAETTGTNDGQALRAYSGSLVSGDLTRIIHNSSAFTGDALQIAMASSSGSFSGKFLNFTNGASEVLTVNSTGWLGIGSTTPSRSLTVNGDMYYANSVATGTATSTNSVITSLLTGLNANFTGIATTTNLRVTNSLGLPYGPAQSAAFNGEFVIDSTSGQVKFMSNNTEKVLGNGNIYASFTYATSTTWTGTTTLPLGPSYVGETWNGIQCHTDAGTLNVEVGDGTNWTNTNKASTTVGTTVFTSNNTFTAEEKRYWRAGTAATSPTTISCTISRSITAD